MILFVFEGGKAEPTVFDSIKSLLLSGEELCIVKCRHDLPTLYSNLKENDYDLFRSLPFEENGIDIPEGKRLDTLFSQIFLFFDYDFQNSNLPIEELNRQVNVMLNLFDDETSNGKLYINYPMIESLRYTKKLPDYHYFEYTVLRDDCHEFKRISAEFSAYKSFDFVQVYPRKKLTEEKQEQLVYNWKYLKDQNVCKANYICNGKKDYPKSKDEISQQNIFTAQESKYVLVTPSSVAILNAFPLFLYDYFK